MKSRRNILRAGISLCSVIILAGCIETARHHPSLPWGDDRDVAELYASPIPDPHPDTEIVPADDPRVADEPILMELIVGAVETDNEDLGEEPYGIPTFALGVDDKDPDERRRAARAIDQLPNNQHLPSGEFILPTPHVRHDETVVALYYLVLE